MRVVFVLLILLVLASFAGAHSNILYDVDVSFDPTLQAGVVQAAQEFYNTDEEPASFDFDRELVVVKFDRTLEYSVTVHPITFAIHGFRNDALNTGGEGIDEATRRQIADAAFDELDERFKDELVYGDEIRTYSGSYIHTWYRYVDGLYVFGDHFEVEIDGGSGDIIAWRLSTFFHTQNEITTNPAFSHGVAQRFAELRLKAQPLDEEPILVADGTRPIWIVKVKSLYPIYVGVDATNGRTVFAGAIRERMPEGYDFGRDVSVVQNDFIRSVFGEE